MSKTKNLELSELLFNSGPKLYDISMRKNLTQIKKLSYLKKELDQRNEVDNLKVFKRINRI